MEGVANLSERFHTRQAGRKRLTAGRCAPDNCRPVLLPPATSRPGASRDPHPPCGPAHRQGPAPERILMPRMRIARSAAARVLALVLVALAAGPTLVSRAEAKTLSKNLLRNPDFEQRMRDHEWMPAGWDTSMSGLPTVFFGRDTLLAYRGSYSV